MLKGKIGFVVQRKSDGYYSVHRGGRWSGVFWQAREAREARDKAVAETSYTRGSFRIQKVLVIPFDCE